MSANGLSLKYDFLLCAWMSHDTICPNQYCTGCIQEATKPVPAPQASVVALSFVCHWNSCVT